MPGYKPQVKSESGEMVDIPIAATYDENGNRLTEQYVSTIAQTFTDEEKAQARANIGAADASSSSKKYRHFIRIQKNGTFFGDSACAFYFIIINDSPTEITKNDIPLNVFFPAKGKAGSGASGNDVEFVYVNVSSGVRKIRAGYTYFTEGSTGSSITYPKASFSYEDISLEDSRTYLYDSVVEI